MYLHKKTYVQNWDHMKPEELTKLTVEGNRTNFINPKRVDYIQEQVGYWRKANAIHNWFVINCGEGEDNCQEYRVYDKQLQKLLDTCTKVLKASVLVKGKIKTGDKLTKTGWEPIVVDGEYIKDSSLANELLPPQSGFFFGGTDYDQYYLDDIKDTIKILKTVLKEIKAGDTASYSYEASW